jgi:methylglutaconyl-CoA hydratase
MASPRRGSPEAIRQTKAHAVASAWSEVAEPTFEVRVEAHAAKRQSAEAAEGLVSFAQKRQARW